MSKKRFILSSELHNEEPSAEEIMAAHVKKCAAAAGPGISKKLQKRLHKQSDIHTGSFYFTRQGGTVIPFDPSFVQLVGYDVEAFHVLRELCFEKEGLQSDLEKAEEKLERRAAKKRLRKFQPNADKHYDSLFNPQKKQRDRLLRKGGKKFYVDPFLAKQIPVCFSSVVA
jgi:hypothetical protein